MEVFARRQELELEFEGQSALDSGMLSAGLVGCEPSGLISQEQVLPMVDMKNSCLCSVNSFTFLRYEVFLQYGKVACQAP